MTISEPLDASTPAGRLEAQLFLPTLPPRASVVLGHGLPSGQPKDPADPGYPGLAARLAEMGLAVATFSFRGCYGSEGDFSLGGWVEDLRAVIGATTARAPGPLAVAASSLGGAVALGEAVSDERVSVLATLAAPASLEDLAGPETAHQFLERVRSIGLIRTSGFPTDVEAWARDFSELVPEQAAADLDARPLLVLHGTDDDTVPVEHAHRLVRAASGPATKVVLTGAGHQLRRVPVAVRVLFAWLRVQLGSS